MNTFRKLVATTLVALLVSIFSCFNVAAQVSSTHSDTVHTPWGYYIWQADFGGATTMLLGEIGFKKSAGLTQIPVNMPAAVTVQEMHGNVSLTIWGASGCGSGSAIAQIRDQDGNALASVNLIGRSSSNINVPISATFGTPIHITSLTFQTYTAQCSALTVSWSLVMS